MSNLPRNPRTTALGTSHEEASLALQRWIWSCLGAGWDPTRPTNTVWSHDDNQQAMARGWMISQPPGSPHLDLYSLDRYKTPPAIMKTLIAGAPIDSLCAKAVATLSAQRLAHPDIKFNYME